MRENERRSLEATLAHTRKPAVEENRRADVLLNNRAKGCAPLMVQEQGKRL